MSNLDLTNGNRAHSPGGRASPGIRFGNRIPFGNPQSHSPVRRGGSPATVSDRPLVPARSLSNTTVSEDLRSTSLAHQIQECCDDDCACGWETYVVDHACQASTSDWKRVSIHRLLHHETDNPLLRDYESGSIRHVHLPANNMTWVQDLILRHYHNQEGDKQYRLLRRDFWHGQQHGRKGPIHSRFMRPRCDIIPTNLDALSATHRDFVISMPYLHWETDERRDKMRRVIDDVMEPGTRTLKGVKISDLNLSKWGKIWIPMAIKKRRKDLLAKADADERLLRKYLTNERPVHIRRTLDQSYYWTLKDTQTRDRDQVVYRATNKRDQIPRIPRVVMVDQLWLWILDGKLVVSSFPRRWGRRKQDPSGVYRTVRERLDDRPNLENVYDMATLIMDQCSRVFFDRTVPRDNRPDVIDMFSNAIGDVTDKSTKAYMDFWDLIRPNSVRYRQMIDKHPNAIWQVVIDKAQRDKNQKKYEDLLLERLLDINPEGELLKEIKDIQDELHMMTKVFTEQQTVVQDFSIHIQQLGGRSKEVTQKTKNEAARLVKEISRRKAEIIELSQAAKRTAEGLKELLDLKQKHANVSEARAGVLEAKQAILRAEETNKILAYTRDLAESSAKQTEQGVRQAEQAAKQNRSLMIFTLVTIVFLPLGFFSSVFGMNAPELGQGGFHIWKQFLIMFPVSIMIIIFSISMALSENFLAVCGTTVQLRWATLLKRLGLFEKWKKKGENLRNIIARQKKELDKLYKGSSGGSEV